MIPCRHWWAWTKPGYLTMTRRQSKNQCSGGIAVHPAPKYSECKNPLESSRLDFLGSRQHPFIDYLLKGQTINTEYYLSLLVQLKDILKEKRHGKFTKFVLFLHDKAPAHLTLATQKNLNYLGFQCLDHAPYSPDLTPSEYHLFSGLKKNNWNFAIFRPTMKSLLTRRPVWTDNFLIFFECLAKVRATD